jgi:hypothetical protein
VPELKNLPHGAERHETAAPQQQPQSECERYDRQHPQHVPTKKSDIGHVL